MKSIIVMQTAPKLCHVHFNEHTGMVPDVKKYFVEEFQLD